MTILESVPRLFPPLEIGKGEIFAAFILGLLLAGFLAETFYGDLSYGFLFLPLAFYSPWIVNRYKKRAEDRKKLGQFLDGMEAFASSLEAGYSAENAVTQSRKELGLLYGTSSFLYKRFQEMERILATNGNLEAAFGELAVALDLKEAEEMAEVIRVVKECGGDMAETVRHGVGLSRERMRLQQEIKALLSGKRYEGQIMKGMPIFILWMLRVSSPDFLLPLYETILGNMIMTGCLVLYGIAWLWEEQIFRICR